MHSQAHAYVLTTIISSSKDTGFAFFPEEFIEPRCQGWWQLAVSHVISLVVETEGGVGGEDGGLEQDVGFTEAPIEIRVYVHHKIR